ncbi:MAG: hypothetical protein CFH06_00152 [Alphaproteobacteria bacterium MarineAlpha3_Bin5]|nr:MAG: hypothetical protein CFH06_00152 [Alphaproteobacteria bacterium MarineAlpha3_Bin5]
MEPLLAKYTTKPIFIHVLLFICILGGIALRFLWGDDFIYNIFIDRDLLRGLYLSDEFQYLGSEIGANVARTPGGLMSYFFYTLQRINPSPEFVHTVIISLDCLVLLLIPKLFTRFIGRESALFVAALYASAPIVLECLWKLWNPSITPLLSVFIYWSLLVFVIENRQWALPLSFALIGITSQFHVSYLILIPLFLIIIFIFYRRQLATKTILFAFCSFLVTYLPYLLIEVPAGFPNFATSISLGLAFNNPEKNLDILSVLFNEGVLVSAARLTGGRTFLQENIPSVLEEFPIFNLGAHVAFNIGLILVAFYIAKLALDTLRKVQGVKEKNKVSPVERIAFLLATAALVVGVLKAENPGARHLVFVLMPGLLFAGIAFAQIDVFISRAYGKNAVIFFSLCVIAMLATKISGTAYHYASTERESASSFAVKEKIVKILSSEFGYNTENMEYKVAHLTLNSEGVPVGSSTNFGISENEVITYIAHINDGLEVKNPRYTGCVLVVMSDRRNKKLPALDTTTILSYLPDSSNLRVERSVNVDGEFLFLGYRFDHPNCLRTMGNAYLPTLEERFADALAAKIPHGGVSIAESIENGTRFGLKLSENPRINALIEVVHDQGLIDVSFHSNALRGYAPSYATQRARASGLSIHFHDKLKAKPMVFSVSNFLGTTGFYTPWNFEKRFLPKGTYKIDLVIEGFQSFIQFGPSAANPNVNNNTRKIKKIRVSNAFIVN